MVQITGRQTGTPQNDSFIGEVLTPSVERSEVQAGVLNATINGLGGFDLISGRSTLEAGASDIELEANGIAQSTISGGLEDDSIFATSSSTGSTPENARSGVIATGRGLFRSSVDGGNGVDTLVFGGAGIRGLSATGIGVESSSVNGGGDADDIRITGFAQSSSGSEEILSTAIGSQNGVITGGGQADNIIIEANIKPSEGSEFNDKGSVVARAVDSSFISGDGGRDAFIISSSGEVLSNADIAAVSNSEVRAGADDDNVSISSFLLSENESDRSASMTTNSAVEKGSLVSGDAGNDKLSILAFGSSSLSSTFYAVNDSKVEGGNGEDLIDIAVSASNSDGAAFGLFDADVDGGNDKDKIEISARLGDFSTEGAAASQSVVKGGSGDDDITISIEVVSSGESRDITGLLDSEIYGNSGDDSILVATEGPVDYNIIDSQLFGGGGDDLFDIGIGNGKLVGGAGNDTAVLNYLNEQTTTITAINNGIRITGTQTNTGQEGAWTQDILSTENYLVDGTTYTNDTLLQTFG